MRLLQLKNGYSVPEDYIPDCIKIKEAFKEHGYAASLWQCYDVWSEYSESYAAGWLSVPTSNNEIFESLKRFIYE